MVDVIRKTPFIHDVNNNFIKTTEYFFCFSIKKKKLSAISHNCKRFRKNLWDKSVFYSYEHKAETFSRGSFSEQKENTSTRPSEQK